MRRSVLRAVAYLLPLVALLSAVQFAVRWGARRCPVNAAGKIAAIMEHRADPEIAIFGASNALVDLDAPLIEKETGRSTYNFGLNGTFFGQYRPLLHEFNAHAVRCKYVVIAESFLTFANVHAVSRPQDYLPYVDVPGIHDAFRALDPNLAWRLAHVPFYSFAVANVDSYVSSALGYRTLRGGPLPDDHHGFVGVDEAWQASTAPKDGWLTEYDDDDRFAAQFGDEIRAIADRGRTAVVVLTPIARRCLAAVPRLDAHRQRLRALVGDAGVLLDYSTDPLASDAGNFYNCGHLNARGAAALSAEIARALPAPRQGVPSTGRSVEETSRR